MKRILILLICALFLLPINSYAETEEVPWTSTPDEKEQLRGYTVSVDRSLYSSYDDMTVYISGTYERTGSSVTNIQLSCTFSGSNPSGGCSFSPSGTRVYVIVSFPRSIQGIIV